MPPVFLPQAVAKYPDNADLSRPLALLGDTIGNAVEGYKEQQFRAKVGEAMKNGDYKGAATQLIEGGKFSDGLALLKMQLEQTAGAQFGSDMRGILSPGGAPAPQTGPLPPPPAPTNTSRIPVQPSATVWGDQEGVNAGIYPAPAAPRVPINAPVGAGPINAPINAPQGPQMAQAGPINAPVNAAPQQPINAPVQSGGQPGAPPSGALLNGVPLTHAVPTLIAAATNPNLPKPSQELARALLMKAVEQNPEIQKLEIFQKRPDLLRTEMDLKRAGATTINTAEGMDAAQTKARIAVDTHAVQDLSKKVVTGRSAIPLLDRMIEINEKTPGGWAGQVSPFIAKGLAAAGLPVPEGISNAELMVAMSRQFIPAVRDPGSTSNYEQSLYGQAVPGLAQSQPGRLLIASMFKQQIQRNSEILKVYRENIGSPDLDKKLSELDSKPIFTQEQRGALESEVKRLSKGGAGPQMLPRSGNAKPGGKTSTGITWGVE